MSKSILSNISTYSITSWSSRLTGVFSKKSKRQNSNQHIIIHFFIIGAFLFVPINACFSQYTSESQIKQAHEILQARGEVILKFAKPEAITIERLNRFISIDRIKNDTIWAYLSAKQFNAFLETNIAFTVIERQAKKASALKSTGSVWNWDKYPNYQEYISMMDSFSLKHAQLCQINNIGSSLKNRKILFCHISSDTSKTKPKVMYTASMHGDEIGGYILMLRLIDFLLNNYQKDAAVTRMVDSLDIWINPLANPDGTYFNDSTVWDATRFNANNIDLNRNFPDPIAGMHPDDNDYQPENTAMISFMKSNHFSLSANFHGGAEVVNYPWDSNLASHADKAWFEYISKEYADSAQYFGRSKYFTDVSTYGFVDGAWWYKVYGGRQDYVTGELCGREVTIELDQNKTTQETELQNLWNYNYRSLLHYLEQGMYGIHGFVTDSATGKPISASVRFLKHDNDSSLVYSSITKGDYYRFMNEGTYDIVFSASGYFDKTYKNIQIKNRETTYLNGTLKYGNKKTNLDSLATGLSVFPNPCNKKLMINTKTKGVIQFFSISGKLISTNIVDNNFSINTSALAAGMYMLKFKNDSVSQTTKLLIVH